MDQNWTEKIDLLSQILEKDIRIYDEFFLKKLLEKRLEANSCGVIEEYIQFLSESNGEAQVFLNSLRVNYSIFFRNPLTFAFLEQVILPFIIKEKNNHPEIRIWSAGCAEGQEAYSFAILLDQLLSSNEKSLSYRIFATDISTSDLEMAKKGIYGTTAIQNVTIKQYNTYLQPDGENVKVSTRLRDHIDFSVYDLLDDRSISPPASIYGDFDLVICSNVLFYFRPEVQNSILNKIYRSIRPGGFLVTGEVERRFVEKYSGFQEAAPPTGVYQKLAI